VLLRLRRKRYEPRIVIREVREVGRRRDAQDGVQA
jgi:hypothetical protein